MARDVVRLAVSENSKASFSKVYMSVHALEIFIENQLPRELNKPRIQVNMGKDNIVNLRLRVFKDTYSSIFNIFRLGTRHKKTY